MHEALLKRVQSALATLSLGAIPEDNAADILAAVSDALTMFKGAPTWAAIDATTPTSMADGHGHHVATRLMAPLQLELVGTVDRTQRRDFWRDLFTGLVGYAEADIGEGQAAAVVWAQALAFCGADAPADNWEQYAKPGETAQACIERHRSEQDGLLSLLTQARATLHAVQAGPIGAAWAVLQERRRQIEVEGWTPEHDDEHDDGGLAVAAAAYALVDHPAVGTESAERLWGSVWDTSWFKPADKRRNLVRSAALLLAEIERIDRAALPASGPSTATGGGGGTEGAEAEGSRQQGAAPAAEGAGGGGDFSGLTAEGLEAGCAGVTLFHTTGSAEFLGESTGDRRYFVVEVHSSGLPAEGDEAGAGSATRINEDHSTDREPGAAA